MNHRALPVFLAGMTTGDPAIGSTLGDGTCSRYLQP